MSTYLYIYKRIERKTFLGILSTEVVKSKYYINSDDGSSPDSGSRQVENEDFIRNISIFGVNNNVVRAFKTGPN